MLKFTKIHHFLLHKINTKKTFVSFFLFMSFISRMYHHETSLFSRNIANEKNRHKEEEEEERKL